MNYNILLAILVAIIFIVTVVKILRSESQKDSDSKNLNIQVRQYIRSYFNNYAPKHQQYTITNVRTRQTKDKVIVIISSHTPAELGNNKLLPKHLQKYLRQPVEVFYSQSKLFDV